jgi:uncharacterized protein YutE (UPF0331/DUF86 family)
MVDRSVVLRKISRIRHYLSRIKEHSHIPLLEFLNDLNTQDIILHNLQLAIQGCIDLGSHIVSDEGWGIPGSFSEIFYLLEEKGVIPHELTEKLVAMAGFRNMIIHEYEKVDLKIVHEILNKDLPDIENFVLKVIDFFKF